MKRKKTATQITKNWPKWKKGDYSDFPEVIAAKKMIFEKQSNLVRSWR